MPGANPVNWIVAYDRAREIAIEREREAARWRLGRAVRDGSSADERARSSHGGPRHAVAVAVLHVGRSVIAAARRLDADVDRPLGRRTTSEGHPNPIEG